MCKKILLLSFILSAFVSAQNIPNLPIPIGAGSAEVYQNEIYFFGGSNNWSGSTVYPRIYKFDGQSWAYHDSIPDNNLWDVETVLVGDEVYLISGWPSGAGFLRKYNFTTREWTYLPSSPNTSTWGVTAEYLDGHIYLFQPTNGNVYDYSIADSMWQTKTNAGVTGPLNLSSILFRNDIYVIGFSDTAFVKYSPLTDSWSALSKPPYPVGASAMGIINDNIYNIGGNNSGSSGAQYKTTIVYDITQDSWRTDSLTLSGKRHWMATAEYKGGLYVLGGIDSVAKAVDVVEQIVPQGTATKLTGKPTLQPLGFQLAQNFPNPFNPVTQIAYTLPNAAQVDLTVYNIRGERVQTLVHTVQAAGAQRAFFTGAHLPSGAYFYVLEMRYKGHLERKARKMVLLK